MAIAIGAGETDTVANATRNKISGRFFPNLTIGQYFPGFKVPRQGQTLRLDHIMSTTLPSLDVVFRIEADWFAIAARDGDDVEIFVL